MMKFPFSKKAMNIMLATALLVTPLATLAPVGGTSVVEAETGDSLPGETVDKLLQLKTYYDGLTAGQKTIINDHRMLLGTLDDDWTAILGDLKGKVGPKLTVSGVTAEVMMTDLADVFLQDNYIGVLSKVVNFHSKYNADFNNAFGVSFIQFLGFYADLIDNVKGDYDQSTIEAAIGDSLTNFMVAEAKKVSNYSTLSAAVKSAVGSEYDVSSLVKIKFDTMNVLSTKSGNYAPGTLKTTLIAAVKQNLNTAPTDNTDTGGGTGGGATPTPEPTPVPGAVDGSSSTTTERETATDGSVNAVTKVDVAKLTEALKNAENVERVTFKIENAAGEGAEARVPARAFEAISAKNPNAKVEIQSSEGTIRVPVKEISVTNIAKAMGVNADDVSINVSIKTSKVVVQPQGGTKSKSAVVQFNITATSGDKSQNINRFNSHVERDISATDDLNADRATVVRLNEDGSIDKAVPTFVDGKKATFNSMSNSLYTIIENEMTFPDITTNWAKDTIEKLASKMIIEGMPSGNFEPTKTTTRAEFAALLTRSLGLNVDAAYDNSFKDVTGSEWFVADMMAAVEVGILEGHTDGTFKGNDAVTREQAAAMIARAMDLISVTVELDDSKSLSDFADESSVSAWASSSVEKLIQAEIINGRPNDQIAPKGDSQRAEVSAMLERFLQSVNFMN